MVGSHGWNTCATSSTRVRRFRGSNSRPHHQARQGQTDQKCVPKWLHAALPGSSLPSGQSQNSSLMYSAVICRHTRRRRTLRRARSHSECLGASCTPYHFRLVTQARPRLIFLCRVLVNTAGIDAPGEPAARSSASRSCQRAGCNQQRRSSHHPARSSAPSAAER